MKIAFVIQKIAARSGGAERVLIETANEMARRGHEVFILSHENRGAQPFYSLNGVKHINLFDRPIEKKAKERWNRREKFREGLSHRPVIRSLKWRMTHGGFVHKLEKFIENERPDVLIPFLPAAITPTALATRKSGVPVIASTHNEPRQDYENRDRWDSNPIDVRLRREVLNEISKILVLLPEYKNWYPAHLHSRISDMPNPITLADPARLARTQREKLIIGVGRLADVKRFDLLIEAWNTLYIRFPDWRVEIYGDGPQREQLQGLIDDNDLGDCVSLMGTVQNIDEVYLRAALMVHPAQYEGFPLAVCEALAHGVPVVGFSDCSGLNSLVEDGKNGVLVKPSSRREIKLENALIKLLPDHGRVREMSRAGPGAMAKYSPEIIYDRWENIIKDYDSDNERDKLYW